MLKFTVFVFFTFLSVITNGQELHFPKIISTVSKKPNQKVFYWGQRWFRKIKYIGDLKDTVLLDEFGYDVIGSNNFPEKIGKELYMNKFDCSNCLSIQIDTSQILPLTNVEWKKNNTIERYYQSFPVIIKNNSDSFYKIGFGLRVNIIAEALDTDNKWKPIEGLYSYKCGTGLYDMFLKPNQIACILFPKYSGNFKTMLRLRLNNNFSEPFIGEIERTQFKIIDDSF